MSAKERGMVSLHQMEDQRPSDKFIVDLNLPAYVDQDRIGVDLDRIYKLCKIAGIGRIVMIGEVGGETSTTIPQVVGMNSDGSAIASRSVVETDSPAFDSSSNPWSPDRRTDNRLINISIKANIDEISMKIADSKEGVRSTSGWARELDKGVRTPIRSLGTRNLVTTRPHISPDLWPLLNAPGFMLNTINFPPDDLIDAVFYGSQFSVYLISRAQSKLMSKINDDHRFSLIPGPQLDRAVWFSVVLASGKLIKDMYPDQKNTPQAK